MNLYYTKMIMDMNNLIIIFENKIIKKKKTYIFSF